MSKQNPLISVKDAVRIVMDHTEDFATEIVSFDKAHGRILKEEVKADRDMPPFDRVSMDGIAINSNAFKQGKRSFAIEGVQAAGSSQLSLIDNEACLEVMTGAVLPKGVDTVIPYEQISIQNSSASIEINEIRVFQNVHKKGIDRKINEVLIDRNKRLGAAEIGVLASTGMSSVRVAKLPKIAIVSTGNELVEVDQTPLPHQIRRSNVHSLYSILNQLNVQADLFHFIDDKESLHKKIRELIENYDVLMFSGAVSKGKFDFLPEVLTDLGVNKLFHRVKQRPGKPFWFGKKDRLTVFAFPGNPVSTFVSCLRYFVPWMNKCLGAEYINTNFAVLHEDFAFKPELTYFLQVKLMNEKGTLFATPVTGNGSGDLANLTLSDAFLELPSNKSFFKKGECFPCISFRNSFSHDR